MSVSWIAILTLMLSSGLGSGGGNELIFYIPIDEYWKSKGVEISVESMAEELKFPQQANIDALLRALGSEDAAERARASEQIEKLGLAAISGLEWATNSPDPAIANEAKALLTRIRRAAHATQIRRLMAIRTLGRMKDPAGIDILAPLIDSREQFIARHARIATAQIRGELYTIPTLAAELMDQDLFLLPRDVALVGQASLGEGRPLGLNDLLNQIPPEMQVDPQMVRDQLIEQLLPIAERIGNVRLDAMTFGLSEQIGHNIGYIVLVARGEFDAGAITALLREQLPADQVAHIQEVEVFRPDPEVGLFFPSNERAVLVVGPRNGQLPVEAMANAIKTGQGELKTNEPMNQLLAGIDRTQPLWAAMRVTDTYRQAPVIKAFDWIRVVGRHEEGHALLEMTAEGSNEQEVQQAVRELEGHIQTAITEMEPMLPHLPMLEPYHAFFKSMRFETDGTRAKITGTLPTTSPVGLLFPMFGLRPVMEVEAQVREMPNAGQPVE